ncbi:MAG TPA: 50S ribosomal protein L21 [Anaerolineales bacterium]|nr:50S ribosomal protein L21 [Anaerolineales bacterium]
MKYAVIESGGKQYVAREGETFEVDRLPQAVGQAVRFAEVLLAADGDLVLVGAPHVDGAEVRATIQAEVRGPKVLVFRYTPKKRFRKRMGHRSWLTKLHVDAVTVPGGRSGSAEAEPAAAEAPKRKAKAARPRTPAPKERPAAAKPAAKKPTKTKK